MTFINENKPYKTGIKVLTEIYSDDVEISIRKAGHVY